MFRHRIHRTLTDTNNNWSLVSVPIKNSETKRLPKFVLWKSRKSRVSLCIIFHLILLRVICHQFCTQLALALTSILIARTHCAPVLCTLLSLIRSLFALSLFYSLILLLLFSLSFVRFCSWSNPLIDSFIDWFIDWLMGWLIADQIRDWAQLTIGDMTFGWWDFLTLRNNPLWSWYNRSEVVYDNPIL